MATNVKSAVKIQSSPRVLMSIRAGRKVDGREARAYVYQILGQNSAKVASAKGTVYDWLAVSHTGKDGSGAVHKVNFEKVSQTAPDEAGHFRVKFALGNGIFRIVQPTEDYAAGWASETKFKVVKDGTVRDITENEARALVGLGPKVSTKTTKTYAPDDEDGEIHA